MHPKKEKNYQRCQVFDDFGEPDLLKKRER